MRRFFAVMCLALPGAVWMTAQGSDADKTPKSKVIVRPECFEVPVEEEALMGIGYAAGGSGVATSSARSRPKVSQSKKKRSIIKPTPKPSPAPSAPPPPPPVMSPQPHDMSAAEADTGPVKAPPRKDLMKEAEKDERVVDGKLNDKNTTSVMDWGATIYLSNDDSMSLASAQRLIWAVQNGARWSISQVRPHELLNYFSFDTVTPDAEQLFDVQISAEQLSDDEMSVAMAVKGAMPERMPLDLTLVVDVSCSMADAGRMDFTQKGLNIAHNQMEKGDRVDVVMFDDTVCVPLENYVVGRDDPELFNRTIAQLAPRGGTNMDLGLKKGYEVAHSKEDTHHRNRRVMAMTDARLNMGDVNHDTVSEIGKAFDKDGIRLTGVGVGRDFNDDVLDKLTEKGKGGYVYLGSEAVVERVFGVGFRSLTETIAHDVHFALNLPDSLALERFYGEEASTVKADVQPINYYAGTSQVFLQDLKIRDGRVVPGDKLEFTVTYRDAQTGEPEERSFFITVGKALDSDPRNVRKARALMAWSDLLLARAMGGDACGDAFDTYRERMDGVGKDLEMGFVNKLVEKTCGVTLSSLPPEETVDYKVKVDSDIPIAEVALACSGARLKERLSTSHTVARFQAPSGSCDLTLSGRVEMTTRVSVPSTGGDVRCVVRGGRMSCS